MILKNSKLFFWILFLCLSQYISANLTTLQYWDPVPFFNAANLNMPPDAQFYYSLKKRLFDEDTDKHRRWGINISPFVQKAIRAQQTDEVYFGKSGLATINHAEQMGDFQGTLYLMGLFLGQDVNGNSIWGGPTAQDTGLTTDITGANVYATNYKLPLNLQNAVAGINNITPANSTGTSSTNAIIFNDPTNPPANTSPSILSQSVLEQDKTYFGALSVPLVYQKAGFRWELNFDVSDNVGFIVRGGFCEIIQRTSDIISLSTESTTNLNQNSYSSNIYGELNSVSNGAKSGTIPYAESQGIYNEWVTNNINDLLDPINGADYDLKTFAQSGLEDIQFLAFVRHPFLLHSVDTHKYPSIIVTPYIILGCTAPIAKVKDYSKLYALSFGNNGHTSIGGVVGLTMDFSHSIEFGFEFGATGFLQQTINELPCPNHELQRVIYPYRQNVKYNPGFNGQFAAIFNAYEFIHNTTFSFRYNYVQHTQDTITLINPSQYFFPNILEELSEWNSQMFIAALTFELQPSIYLSIAWQGALSQKNAYCSNTILGSLNFQF
jgi:hypothetical protein